MRGEEENIDPAQLYCVREYFRGKGIINNLTITKNISCLNQNLHND